jgi:hypothetical protein
VGFAFVAEGQPAVAGQPGDGPLDLPPVTAQALTGLDAAPGDPRGDAALPQPGPVSIKVISLVRAELGGTPAARPAPGPDGGNAPDQRARRLAVVGVRRADGDG